MIRTFVFHDPEGNLHSKVFKITDHFGSEKDVILNTPEGHKAFEWLPKHGRVSTSMWKIDVTTKLPIRRPL